MQGRPSLTFAPFFAGLMMLWPVAAYTGAQGFTIIIGWAAFPAWYFARPRSLPLYALAFAAFIIWAIASSAWSPATGPIYEGSLVSGNFSVNAVVLRIGLTAFAIASVLMAAAQLPQRPFPRSVRTLYTIPAVQGAGVLITALAMGFILNLLAPISDPVLEMPQNLLRNVNAYVILLPLLLAWLWTRPSRYLQASALIILGVSFFAAHKTGSQSSMVALVLIALSALAANIFRRNCVRISLYAIGLYTLLAPFAMMGLANLVRASGLEVPLSFWSRMYSWQRVTEEAMAKPFTGSGIEASETWREFYQDRPDLLAGIVADTGKTGLWDQYPIIPGHPHSMALQIWAETGLIGAGLVGLSLILLARRLGSADTWQPVVRFASMGLVAATLTFYAVSYSVWNEAFWCSIALSAAAILVISRHQSAP
ncbi:MAG: hypothetical protein Hens3KO_11440 [Henriciella sp.]